MAAKRRPQTQIQTHHPLGRRAYGARLLRSRSYDDQPWCLGTIFSVSVPGKLTGVKLYAVQGESGQHTFRLWDNQTGKQIGATRTFSADGAGWRTYVLPTPTSLMPGASYTVAITTGGDQRKRYAALVDTLQSGGAVGSVSYPANAGVFGTVLDRRPTEVWRSTNYLRDIVFVAD